MDGVLEPTAPNARKAAVPAVPDADTFTGSRAKAIARNGNRQSRRALIVVPNLQYLAKEDGIAWHTFEHLGCYTLPLDPHERHPFVVAVAEPDLIVRAASIEALSPIGLDLPVLPGLLAGGDSIEPFSQQSEMQDFHAAPKFNSRCERAATLRFHHSMQKDFATAPDRSPQHKIRQLGVVALVPIIKAVLSSTSGVLPQRGQGCTVVR